MRYESGGKETGGKSKPPKEVSIHPSQNEIKSPLSDEEGGMVMNGNPFPVEEVSSNAMAKMEHKPSIGIYQIIIDRKTQDIMTIREFIKKEFFRKVSGIFGTEY